MLRILLMCLSMMLMPQLFAQFINYDFTYFTEEYEELLTPIPLHANSTWDDPQWVVPLGFEFQFNENYYTHIRFEGLNSYGGELVVFNPGFEEDGVDFIFPFAQDLRDLNYFEDDAGPASPVTFQSSGAIGNRVFKLQWDDAGFYGDGSSTMKIDLQLWLYELGGVIEFRFGENENIVLGDIQTWNGAFCGLGLGLDNDLDNYVSVLMYLTGSPDAPVAEESGDFFEADIEQLTMMSDIPADGQVYRFDNTVSVERLEDIEHITAYYSADFHAIQLMGQTTSPFCTLIDSQGRVVFAKQQLASNSIHLPAELSAGVYVLQLEDQGSSKTFRFVLP